MLKLSNRLNCHRAILSLTSVVSTCGLATEANAAPKPMELAAIYDDSISTDLKIAKGAKPCELSIASLTDERRDPAMVGVFLGRAVRAPINRDAWFRSIIDGLKSRNVTVTDSAGERSTSVPVGITMTKAWITNTSSNMSATIVFRLKSIDKTDVATEQNFRGAASHSSYFSGGPSELQRTFDKAVSRALDAMAADIHTRCGNIVT